MLTISQFSNLSLIPTKTLRYYDEIALLKPDYIDPENSYRYYSVKQLEISSIIKRLRSYNFSIIQIKMYLEDNSILESLLKEKSKEIDSELEKYSSMKLNIEQEMKSITEGGKLMMKNVERNIEIVNSPEYNIYYIRKEIDVKNFSNLVNELFETAEKKHIIPVGAPVFIYHSPEYTPDHYDVEVGIPVREKTADTRLLKSCECVKYYYKGSYTNIPQVYATVAKWIEENGYSINGSVFEFYLTDPNNTLENENEMDIYFPIRKVK